MKKVFFFQKASWKQSDTDLKREKRVVLIGHDRLRGAQISGEMPILRNWEKISAKRKI